MSEERVLISDKPGHFVSFTNDAVQYGMVEIPYTSVESTSFYAVAFFLNSIPYGNRYHVDIASSEGNIRLRLISLLRIRNRRKRDIFSELLHLCDKHIHPHIGRRMLTQIFVEDQTIAFDSLRINRKGIGSTVHQRFLPWSEFDGCGVSEGFLIIQARNPNKPNKPKSFTGFPAGALNARVLPRLFQGIVKELANPEILQRGTHYYAFVPSSDADLEKYAAQNTFILLHWPAEWNHAGELVHYPASDHDEADCVKISVHPTSLPGIRLVHMSASLKCNCESKSSTAKRIAIFEETFHQEFKKFGFVLKDASDPVWLEFSDRASLSPYWRPAEPGSFSLSYRG